MLVRSVWRSLQGNAFNFNAYPIDQRGDSLCSTHTPQVHIMHKISAPPAVNSDMNLREVAPASARSAMSPLELTPLLPPGSEPGLPGAAAPSWRNAVFDRAFEDLQLKLGERRRAGPETQPGVAGELGTIGHRECDTALQWISACLISARES